MKVCHMTSVHSARDGRILERECVSLAKEFEVVLVCREDSFQYNGVDVIGLGFSKKGRLKRVIVDSYQIYKEAKKQDADIYQIHDPELLPYAYLLKRQGKKVIFDSHENVRGQIKEKKYLGRTANLVSFCYSKLENYISKRLDGIISVDENVCNQFRRINDNVVCIRNFPLLNEKKINLEHKIEKNIIIFAGGISDQWSLKEVAEACLGLDVEIRLYGVGSQSYIDSVLSINNNVKYMGKVNRKEVLSAYEECLFGLALLKPGLNTNGKIGTMGNTKLFEIMSCGKPVLCTDFECWKPIIDKYSCGSYVEVSSIEQIRKQIEELIQDNSRLKKMGKNAYSAHLNEYNWKKEEEKLIKYYLSLSNLYDKNLRK